MEEKIKIIEDRWRKEGEYKELEDNILSLKVLHILLQKEVREKLWHFESTPRVRFSLIKEEERELLKKELEEILNSLLRVKEREKFLKELERLPERFSPFQSLAEKFRISFLAQAHIDLAWLWRWRETIEVCRGTFEGVLARMEEYPDLIYAQSQAKIYEWMESFYPEIFQKIKDRVKEGRWEIVGGMWVECDGNLPDGESFIRQIEKGKEYYEKNFSFSPRVEWLPDSFGYNWKLVQILQDSGIKYLLPQKITWNDTNPPPYRIFWWEGPDGSRILCLIPFIFNGNTDPLKIANALKQQEILTGYPDLLWLFGVGDHGGGPTREMMEGVERLKKLPLFPPIRYIRAHDYFQELEQFSPVPSWKDELYLEYHRGTFTVQSDMKKWNRQGEIDIQNLEKLEVLFNRRDMDMDREWKILLFQQFHDILPGSSIRPVYQDAREELESMKTLLEEKREKILKGRRVQGIHVFNPLNWERVFILETEGEEEGYFRREDGRTFPAWGEDGKTKSLVSLPPLKVSTFHFKKDKPTLSPVKVSSYTLENEFFRIELNPRTGNISRIYDQKRKREILSGEGNRLLLREEKTGPCTSWNIRYTGREGEAFLRKIEIPERNYEGILRVEKGFLWKESKKKYVGETILTLPGGDYPTSFFTQEIILQPGVPWIDFRIKIDWWEDNILLKLVFPFNLSTTRAVYRIPYGTIERSTLRNTSYEKARFEVPSHGMVTLRTEDLGITFLIFAKYGFEVEGSELRATLLCSPYDENRTSCPDIYADRGKHEFFYRIHIHDPEENPVKLWYEFNYPPLLLPYPVRKEPLFSIEPENLISGHWFWKDGKILIRIEESKGRKGEGKIRINFPVKEVYLCDLLGNPRERLPLKEKEAVFPYHPFSLLTLSLNPKEEKNQ